MDVFVSDPGTIVVVRAKGNGASSGLIQIDELNSSKVRDVFITGFSIQNSVSASFSPTIGGPEYLYVYGDKLAPISVDLLLVETASCDEETNGIQTLSKYYFENRLKPNRAQLVTIIYGGITIRGFVTGNRIGSEAGMQRMQVTQGQLQLVGWMEESSISGGNSGGTQPVADGGGTGGTLGAGGNATRAGSPAGIGATS